ncbi:MAG: hypothetical protein RQ750_14260 [Roseovarius sp.]|nr:hypothetical protein [Roseovarius sp.]
MAMRSGLWSISAIATEFGMDRRTVAKRLEGIDPAGEKSGHSAWRLADVISALTGRAPEQRDEIDEASDKARLMRAKADIAEFEARRLSGELVLVEDAEAAWIDAAARFRARCLGIPSKAAPMVAQEGLPETCHEIIETFIHEALAELAEIDVEGGAPTGGFDAQDVDGDSAAAEADDI